MHCIEMRCGAMQKKKKRDEMNRVWLSVIEK